MTESYLQKTFKELIETQKRFGEIKKQSENEFIITKSYLGDVIYTVFPHISKDFKTLNPKINFCFMREKEEETRTYYLYMETENNELKIRLSIINNETERVGYDTLKGEDDLLPQYGPILNQFSDTIKNMNENRLLYTMGMIKYG